MTIPVYLTGEPAEEIVENLAGVSEAVIAPHEDAAFNAMVAMELTGVLALASLIFYRRSFGSVLLGITSLSSIVPVGLILWTANLGGQIRHTEIRADFTAPVNSEKQEPPKVEKEDDN